MSRLREICKLGTYTETIKYVIIFVGKALSKYTTSRDNNFNLIRFVAAVLVLYSHSYPLSKGPNAVDPLGSFINMTWGGIAVDVFFITSGFLITYSFFSRNNIIAFIWARLIRIYPALIVATLFCVFVVGLFFTTNTISDYLSDPQTLKYFRRNATLFSGVKYELPGVFASNPYANAVNGSLWTLPYEIKMYTYLAIIAFTLMYAQKWLGKRSLFITFLSIAVVSVAANTVNHFILFTSVEFVRLFSMFFIGVAFYIFREHIFLSSRLFLLALVVLSLSTINKDLFFVTYSVLLPYLVFYIAYIPAGSVRKYNKVGDYSYGMYIYAFPVQQSIAAIIPNVSVTNMIVIAFVITLILAVVSWHLIEQNFLKMKRNYVIFEKVLRKSKSS